MRFKIFTLLLLLLFQFAVSNLQAQGENLIPSLGDSSATKNPISSDSAKVDSTNLKFKFLPFAFYHNTIGGVIGTLASFKGFVQKETFAKVGGILSTNGSRYIFMQVENMQIPSLERFFVRPDIYVGKLGEIKEYISDDANGVRAGANESDPNSYIKVHGTDCWIENTIKYLLPIGDGKDSVVITPRFISGILISGETGGKSWNPLESGRMFVGTKFIYRNMKLYNDNISIHPITTSWEFSLSHENMDYFFNPTVGSYKKISYTKDWGWFNSNSKSDVLKLDMRWYFPLYDKNSDALPRVLAINFYTADIPSWNDYDIIDGLKSYHRPQLFAGANLGGVKYLRSYKDLRFYDKSLIYYSAEYRQNIAWNPFNYWDLTRRIGVDFIQLAGFVDLGRVAPEWKISTLHSDMKYSIGGGFRLFIDGLVVRVDVGGGKDGAAVQMFVDQPF